MDPALNPSRSSQPTEPFAVANGSRTQPFSTEQLKPSTELLNSQNRSGASVSARVECWDPLATANGSVG